MFTGLVRELGKIKNISKAGNIHNIEVTADLIEKEVTIGDSVSINGACLTLTGKNSKVLFFDVMGETMERTALASLKTGDMVNLEDSLKAGKPLGGHFVLGHVDCVGTIDRIDKDGDNYTIAVSFPDNYSHLVVEKGSVALDGISLTIGKVGKGHFNIHIIPHTLKMTNLSSRKKGDKINLEFDIIGKYLARFRQLEKGEGVTEQFLKEMGF